MSVEFELNVKPWTKGPYPKVIKEILNDWRKTPDKYGFGDNSLIMKGYTELWADYSLDQDETWWVGEYIITPFIFNRIKNEVNTKKEKFSMEFTFDFINDNGEIYKGIGERRTFDGIKYYLRDEDFDKIKFPNIPIEVPDYVYLIHKLKTEFKDFEYLNPDIQIKITELKIGEQFKLDNGKTIIALDSGNGKLSIIYKENSK